MAASPDVIASALGRRRVARRRTAIATCAVLLVGCSSGSPARSIASPSRATPTATPLSLVAIGDSIPYNSSADCPGCIGFIDQYAAALEKATGKHVNVENLSEHNGLTLPQLLAEIDRFHGALSTADVILIGIAHNSFELNADAPCGGPLVNMLPTWSLVNDRCAGESAARSRASYQTLYSGIAALRAGKPTILRTLNRYNDFIGLPEPHLTHAQELKTKVMLDAWDTMLCSTAKAEGVGCADIYHAFNGPDGTKPAASLLGPDYTHPSQKGNDAIEHVLEGLGYEGLT